MYYNDPNAQFYGGYHQVPNRSDIPWTNPLDEKGESKIKKNQPEFNLQATEEDLLKASCTHRDPKSKSYTLIQNPDGSLRCTRCGTVFNLVDTSVEEIEKYISTVNDILQTTKLLYVNMPIDVTKTFFSMIPFLDKVPKLYELAQKVNRQATGGTPIQPYNYVNQDPFALIRNATMSGGIDPYAQQYYAQQAPNPQFTNPQYFGAGAYPQQGTPQFVPNQNGYYGDPAYNPIQQGAAPQPMFYNSYVPSPAPAQQAPQNGNIPIQSGESAPQQNQAPAAPKQGDPVTTNKQFQL